VKGIDVEQTMKGLKKPSAAGRPATARGKSWPPPVQIAPGRTQPFNLAIHHHVPSAKQRFQRISRKTNSFI
jgi:hypothetical protein